MKRYVLVILDEENGAEVEIGKAEKEDLFSDVLFRKIDEKVLEEGLPVFSESENQTFKAVVEGAITLLQRAQQIEENQ